MSQPSTSTCLLHGCGEPVPPKIPGTPGRPRDYCSDTCQRAARRPRPTVAVDDAEERPPLAKHPVHQYDVGQCRCGRVSWLYSLVNGPERVLCSDCIRAFCDREQQSKAS